MSIYFGEGDGAGWAIDEDLRLLRKALGGETETTKLADARIVVAVWWWKLLRIPRKMLAGKVVVALADNPPFRYVQHPSFLPGCELVDLWVGRSQEAISQFDALGLRSHFAPYAVDQSVFVPVAGNREGRKSIRQELGISGGAFLVGNFHRDGEGPGGDRPKFQKAPEVFVEILRQLRDEGIPVHAILAGPRRKWMRRALRSAGIATTFVGDETIAGDDYPANILPRSTLCGLYNSLDAYVITSRWEGGPHSVLEAIACECPVIATRVGVCRDVLPEGQLFASPEEGAALLRTEFESRALQKEAAALRSRVLASHTPDALGHKFGTVMEVARTISAKENDYYWKETNDQSLFVRLAGRLRSFTESRLRVHVDSDVTRGVAHEFLESFFDLSRIAVRSSSQKAHVSIVDRGDWMELRSTRDPSRRVDLCFSVEQLVDFVRQGKSLHQLTVLPPLRSNTATGGNASEDPASIVERFETLLQMVRNG
jgi:glycosyltransferase involved in cell wall biosynthesis